MIQEHAFHEGKNQSLVFSDFKEIENHSSRKFFEYNTEARVSAPKHIGHIYFLRIVGNLEIKLLQIPALLPKRFISFEKDR